MNVLVTGANGFVGQAIVSELCGNSHEVFAVSRTNSENQNPNFVKSENYFRADITDKNEVRNIKPPEQIETVIHCAGLAHQFENVAKKDFWETNVAGTENILNLATSLKIKHFILISSVAVYGGNFKDGDIINEDSECQPQDDYAESKLAGEQIARKICEEKGTMLTILRPATVIGEGDRGNFLRLIGAIDKKRFLWIGKGENRKSLIHKTDVAKACTIVLKKKNIETEIFNIAAEPLLMKEIVDEIALELNVKIPKFTIPLSLIQKIFSTNLKTLKNRKIEKLAQTIKKWTAEDVYSAEKLKKRYGFQAKVSAREAIKREVGWYLADNLNKNV